MNRAMKRKMNKMVKTKVTEEQFQELKQDAIDEMIQREAYNRFHLIFNDLVDVMRENRISEERIGKIMDQLTLRLRAKGEKKNAERLLEQSGDK